MQRPTTDQQDRLHHDFTAALDLLDKENREPNRWEEECLSYALGALACGLYLAAEVELAAFARGSKYRDAAAARSIPRHDRFQGRWPGGSG